MELEEAIKELQEKIETINTHLKNYEKDRCLTAVYENLKLEKEALETIINHLTKQKKRISDLEFSLMDMVLQFADESKDSINTRGLSALETAFSELDFDNPMPIKKVHEQYKKLAKQYFEKKVEEYQKEEV